VVATARSGAAAPASAEPRKTSPASTPLDLQVIMPPKKQPFDVFRKNKS
jgi:hypothetical protein